MIYYQYVKNYPDSDSYRTSQISISALCDPSMGARLAPNTHFGLPKPQLKDWYPGQRLKHRITERPFDRRERQSLGNSGFCRNAI